METLEEVQLLIKPEDKNTCQSIEDGTLKDFFWINIELLPLEYLNVLNLIFLASVLIYLLEPFMLFVIGFVGRFIWEIL